MVRALARLVLVSVTLAAGAAAASVLWSPAGAAPPDLTYNAVTPCVVFDSRAGQGATGGFVGPINGGQAVVYDLVGGFAAAQGGGSTDCGIPASAAAVQINVVAVNALNEGNLRVTDGSPAATGGLVNYNTLTPKLNSSNAAIVPLSETGTITVTPNCGAGCTADTTEVRGVVLGYFDDTLAALVGEGINNDDAQDAQIEQLQSEIDDLQALLAGVTRLPDGDLQAVGGKDTLRFSGMNLQIVDGTGSTACTDGNGAFFDSPCNGRGNLVVGYSENGQGYARTGSHNLVAGTDNGWTSYSGVVTGLFNRITNDHATILGGTTNRASAEAAVIVGGEDNKAEGILATAIGGDGNSAGGQHALAAGGVGNFASGPSSVVAGGLQNSAPGNTAVASGGQLNTSVGDHGTIVGGRFNATTNDGTTCADGIGAGTVTGGQGNVALGCSSTVSGGQGRSVTGEFDWRAGALFQDV